MLKETTIESLIELYGEYQGEEFSVLRNYYNKPLATFNWDWQISSNVTLATSLYGSAGRGGGTGLRGRGSFGTTCISDESFADYLEVIMVNGEILTTTINWNVAVQKNTAGAYVPTSGKFQGNEA